MSGGPFVSWDAFVTGIRTGDPTSEPFRLEIEQVLDKLLNLPAIVGRQSASWCLRDCIDADASEIVVSPWPKGDKMLRVCSFTGVEGLKSKHIRKVEIRPTTRFCYYYTVHRDVVPLLQAVHAVSSIADYVTTHSKEETDDLFHDIQKCISLIQKVTALLN
jgi:hypothetical protein